VTNPFGLAADYEDARGSATADEEDLARVELAELGWALFAPTRNLPVWRAERGGALKHEQAASTLHGLLEAVRKREAQIQAGEIRSTVPVR
jgi:hypothetical protein